MADLSDDLHDAIAVALAKHETSMLTRWVLIAESVEDDGARGLLHFAVGEQGAQFHRDDP